MQLDFFSNDNYKVLKTLSDRQMKYKDEKYASITQQELADVCQFSKGKCTKIVKKLLDEGFISNYNNRKNKYKITERGKLVIKLMTKEI